MPPTCERLPWLSLKWLCALQSPVMLPKHTSGLRLLHQLFHNLPLWEALESCQGHLFCPPPNLLWQTVLDPYSTAHLLSGRASSLFRC